MKYPQLVSMPSAISDWLEEQLEARGIDSEVYTRYILSLLHAHTLDVIYPEDEVTAHFKKDGGRGAAAHKRFRRAGAWWRRAAHAEAEQIKRSAAVECLTSAAEQGCEIESLVDELCEKLKEVNSEAETVSPSKTNQNSGIPKEQALKQRKISPKELAEKYYAAFPPLNQKECNSYFSSNINLVARKWPSPEKSLNKIDIIAAKWTNSGSPKKSKRKSKLQPYESNMRSSKTNQNRLRLGCKKPNSVRNLTKEMADNMANWEFVRSNEVWSNCNNNMEDQYLEFNLISMAEELAINDVEMFQDFANVAEQELPVKLVECLLDDDGEEQVEEFQLARDLQFFYESNNNEGEYPVSPCAVPTRDLKSFKEPSNPEVGHSTSVWQGVCTYWPTQEKNDTVTREDTGRSDTCKIDGALESQNKREAERNLWNEDLNKRTRRAWSGTRRLLFTEETSKVAKDNPVEGKLKSNPLNENGTDAEMDDKDLLLKENKTVGRERQKTPLDRDIGVLQSENNVEDEEKSLELENQLNIILEQWGRKSLITDDCAWDEQQQANKHLSSIFSDQCLLEPIAISRMKINHSVNGSAFVEYVRTPNLYQPFGDSVGINFGQIVKTPVLPNELKSDTPDFKMSHENMYFRPIKTPVPRDEGLFDAVSGYKNGSTFKIRGTPDKVEYKRSNSGSIYTESEFGEMKCYKEYTWQPVGDDNFNMISFPLIKSPIGLSAEKFKIKFEVSQNNKGSQTEQSLLTAFQYMPSRQLVNESTLPAQESVNLCGETQLEKCKYVTQLDSIRRPDSIFDEEVWCSIDQDTAICKKCKKSFVKKQDWPRDMNPSVERNLDTQDIREIWGNSQTCGNCRNSTLSPFTEDISVSMRMEIKNDGERLLSDVNKLQRAYNESSQREDFQMEEGSGEPKSAHNHLTNNACVWSFATRLQEDLINLSTLPTLRSVTL